MRNYDFGVGSFVWRIEGRIDVEAGITILFSCLGFFNSLLPFFWPLDI